MSHKVYAVIGGQRVVIGRVVRAFDDGATAGYSLELDVVPVNGRLDIELHKDVADRAVLRVRDLHTGSFYAKAGDAIPKIPAIKAYREVTGCGLGEAKSWIENHTPTEQKGLGAWGRPAWDYELSPELVSSLNERALIAPLRASPPEIEGSFPAWEVVFF